MQANCAVCKTDDSGATTLSPSGSPKDLYGTQSVGLYGRIRSWKSVSELGILFLIRLNLLSYLAFAAISGISNVIFCSS